MTRRRVDIVELVAVGFLAALAYSVWRSTDGVRRAPRVAPRWPSRLVPAVPDWSVN